jgi:hypothetical protein
VIPGYRMKTCEGQRPLPDEGGGATACPAADHPAGAQMRVHPATLPFNLTHLALAVVLKAGLERQQSGMPREHLEGGQPLSAQSCIAA